MRKMTIEELTRKFNILREQTGERTFSGRGLDKYLMDHGFSKVFIYVMKRQNCFDCVYKGAKAEYSFKNEPLYIGKMKSVYSEYKGPKKENDISKHEESIKECIEILKNEGYQIRKWKGIDVDAFRKDYPGLFEKYSIFETFC